MTAGPAARLLERLVRHRAARALAVLFLAWLVLMFHVRGEPVPAGEVADLPRLVARMSGGAPSIASQQDLDAVAQVAYALCRAEGRVPGPFYVLYLPELDALEKFHHLMHGPFTGIKRMYCDVWLHSVTTYGRAQSTWGIEPVAVRPSLKLPILLFLLDRLAREKTAFGEYIGAVFEAFAGMEMHTLPGRARLWERVFAAAARDEALAGWIARQLASYERGWVDDAEVAFWAGRGPEPAAAQFVAEVARRRALKVRSWPR